jgi:radical SAM protein with 4Fe4S-binding SPASM domain
MHIRLNTNATKLTPELSEKLITNGLQEIVFSFEGFNKQEYERIRVGANYEQTLSNINQFLEINDSYGHPVKTELFVIRIPDVDSNLINTFHNIMKDKFDTLCFVGCMDWVGQIPYIKNEYPIILSYNNWCSALDTDLNILYNGTVVPCCFDIRGIMPIGNFTTTSLDEILNSKEREKFIKKIKTHNLEDTLCKNCTNMLSQNTIIINNLLKPKRIYRYVRNFLHSI